MLGIKQVTLTVMAYYVCSSGFAFCVEMQCACSCVHVCVCVCGHQRGAINVFLTSSN